MFESVCSAFLRSRSHSQYANKHQVLVNVYDMLEPSFLTHVGHALGVGIYHSGVEIGGREYCFGGHEYDNLTGVFSVEPRVGPPGVLYKQTILIGYVDMTEAEISQVLQTISQEFMGTSYNLLTRNCNHFTEELCRRLCNKSSPGWINRAAKLGAMFPCVIPDEWVEPPEFETDPTVQSPTSFGSSQPASPAMSYSSRTPLKSSSMRGRRGSSRHQEQYGSSHNSTMVSSHGSRPTSPTSITLGRKSNQQPLHPPQAHQQQRQQPQVSQSSPTSRQSSKASFDLRTFQHATQHHRRRSSVPSSSASPSRRPSGAEDRDSIVLIRTSSPLMMMQDDDFDADDPVKEPDCTRPEVIRSATQISISASLQELDRPLSANGREPVSPVSPH